MYGLRTFKELEIKRKCVQVTYSEESKIHIDVPIYCLTNVSVDLQSYLATGRGWTASSPCRFERWYSERYTAQLTWIVRYVKAWADNQSQLAEMLKGVALTVLVAIHYRKHERDDISLVQTLMAIEAAQAEQWHYKMPIEPFDNLLRK